MDERDLEQRLAGIRHLGLDLDGTIYRDGVVFEFTKTFLARLDKLGIGYTYITNNSSQSTADYCVKLKRIGLPTPASQVLTSGRVTIDWLAANYPDARALNVLGTRSLRDEFREAGYSIVEKSEHGDPDVVVVAFDTEISYSRLCTTAYWIAKGRPYVATHPDLVCPTDLETVLVDCGALCACLESVTGRRPDEVPGKPNPCMLDPILARHDIEPSQLAIVGDRLYTDMEMASRTGALGVLVLTGEATREEAQKSPLPDLIVENIDSLGDMLSKAKRSS
ncbi:MAG TPA: HAD-IIA family hydrolase [Planctomycetes bacterium]|nr:HAD-IIA family hydrolase [Planctomycetaceae bacterium]HIM28451.1 HAD-IIA family hydrolase [Planctomycetota bacterium]